MGAVNASAVVVRQISAEASIKRVGIGSAEFVRGHTTILPLTITENGTYTAPMGTAYSPVVAETESASDIPWASEGSY